MRIFGRDLLTAWLVLLLVSTGISLARNEGRVAGAPLWALCGDSGGAGIAAPDAPTGHHLCLDCLAPALAAAPTPLIDRTALPTEFVPPVGALYDAPADRSARRPAIRAPPIRA